MARLPIPMSAKPAPLSLALPDGVVAVQLTRRPRQSVALRIRDGVVEMIAPPTVSLAALQDILAQKRDWIAGHLARQRQEDAQREQSRGQVMLAGQTLRLAVEDASRHRARIDGEVLQLAGPGLQQPARLAAAVVAWLQKEARQRFCARLEAWEQRAARPLSGWALSSARTRWGSCTSQGIIRLNWRLVQAPPAVLDYVIAHELAHLRHMNHSPAFWAEVERLYPGWQPARQWLKTHGNSLFRYG
ncbi:putative metal-dependent hydrolase [Vogesella perlucida]|nr:putative metal-dependent hydrolase [Vogesella perlucida]